MANDPPQAAIFFPMVQNKLSIENHAQISAIHVRFDGMIKPEIAWLAEGSGLLALVFDQSEFDIDLSTQTFGIAYQGRRWRLDAPYSDKSWLTFDLFAELLILVAAKSSLAAIGLAGFAGAKSAEFWYHYRFVLNDGRAFEFFVSTKQKTVVKAIERLKKRTGWRRRFKRWTGLG